MSAKTGFFVFLSVGLVVWIILIFVGMGIITKKVISYNDSLTVNCMCPNLIQPINKINLNGVDFLAVVSTDITTNNLKSENGIILTTDEMRLSKMSIIMFWILILPLSIFAIIKFIKH